MAIDFDAFSVRWTNPGFQGDTSWSHTPAGTPKGVLVFVVSHNTLTDNVVGVTYDGVSLTEISGSPFAPDNIEDSVVHVFFLGSSVPTTSPATVAIDLNESSIYNCAYCYTVTASGNTEINATATIQGATVTDPSTSLALNSTSSFVAQAFYSGVSAPTGATEFSGWTAKSEQDFGAATTGSYSYDTIGTADVTVGYTAASDDVNLVAVAIKEAAGGGATISPTQGALTITGHAPTVTSPISITPSVGALVLTGLAPVANLTHSANTGVGELSITGQAPDITVTAGQAITTDVGVLTLAGLAPVVNLTHSSNTGTGELTITGLAPDVTTTVAGTVNTGLGALTITGHAPTIVVSLSVTTDVGALNITGYEPTLQVSGPIAISTEFGALYLTGYAPSVTNLGDVVSDQPNTIGGKPEKKAYKKKAKLPFYDSEQEYESRVQVDEVQVEKPAKKAKVVPISDKAIQKKSAKIAKAPLLGDLVQEVQIAPIEVMAVEVIEEDEALIEDIVVSLLLAA